MRDQQKFQPAVNAAVKASSSNIKPLTAMRNPTVDSDLAKALPLIEVTKTSKIENGAIVSKSVQKTFEHGHLVNTKVAATTVAAANVVPNSRGCWGVHSTAYYSGASTTVWVEWRRVTENGWCGDGVSVTRTNGATYQSVDIPGFCWNDVEHNSGFRPGPMGPHIYRHAQNYAYLGGSYIIGCMSVQKIAPGIIVRGNGWWAHGY